MFTLPWREGDRMPRRQGARNRVHIFGVVLAKARTHTARSPDCDRSQSRTTGLLQTSPCGYRSRLPVRLARTPVFYFPPYAIPPPGEGKSPHAIAIPTPLL